MDIIKIAKLAVKNFHEIYEIRRYKNCKSFGLIIARYNTRILRIKVNEKNE